MSTETQVSPLTEVKEDSLNDIFMKDPLGLSEVDIERIVVEYRRKREQWNVAEAQGARRAPRAKALPAPKAKPDAALSLEELDL